MSGFRKFLMRGNLIDLAVAVVVGVAFNAIVHSLVNDLITPLIGAFGGQPNFAGLVFHVGKSGFKYGDFINAVVSFLIIALVVYYFLVAPSARLTAMAASRQAATTRECPECLSTIPIGAKRCMYCTAEVPPVPPAPDVPQPRRSFRHSRLTSPET